MELKLFLTGPSGCGKTTMISNALGDSVSRAGGFITRRVFDRGRIAGFDLLPSMESLNTDYHGHRFLDFTEEKTKAMEEVFRVEAVSLLRAAKKYPFSLVDEFGGFELLIPEFREALWEFLASPVPCIGVFKGDSNSQSLQRGLKDSFISYRPELLEAMHTNRDIRLIETTGRYDRFAIDAVNEWCHEYT